MTAKDDAIVQKVNKDLAAAEKNLQQGDMGQVLALGKDQEIKKSISDLKTNFQSLTQQMRSDYE